MADFAIGKMSPYYRDTMMKKITLVSAALLVCLVAVWVHSEVKLARAVRPPEGVTNLVAFLELRPQVIEVRKFHQDSKLYIEVVARVDAPLLALPSGPPAYVFDESGALVDWCGDLGDSPSFEHVKWAGINNASVISREEAKQLVK